MNTIPLLVSSTVRPDRISTPEASKDLNYHAQYGRFVAGQCNNDKQRYYIQKCEIVRSFYSGKQWILPEDLTTFFMDDNGQTNNRIMAVRNYILPMVEQYRGNALNMSFRYGVRNISPGAKTRRDEKLNRMLVLGDAARKSPLFKKWLDKAMPAVSVSDQETQQTFSAFYRDQFAKEGTRLLNAAFTYGNLDSFKGDLAVDLSVAGIALLDPYIRGGKQLYRKVIPERFAWDRAAVDPQLKDAEFFLEYSAELLSDIFEEHYDLDPALRRDMERVAKLGSSGLNSSVPFDINGRAHVYKTRWRDIIPVWAGYVLDEFGTVSLKRLNYDYTQVGKPTYTDADLVAPDKLTPFQKKTIGKGGASKVMIPCEQWRYCKFIPREWTSVGGNSNLGDVVLDYGVIPYQEEDLFIPLKKSIPYKVCTWIYIDGEVISPAEGMINPQRLVNRFLSVMENQVNNSGGSGPVVDEDQLGGTDTAEVQKNMKRGQPVFLHAKGQGVQNAVGLYDTSLRQSTLVLSNLIDTYKRGMEDESGVNQALKGQAGPDQLVGVMQLMMQKGSVIQEPFYDALQSIYRDVAQSILSVGRYLYTDNEEVLHDMAGTDAVETFKLSRNIRYEQLMVDVTRIPNPEADIQSATQMAMQFFQLGILDKKRLGQVLGKATTNELYDAVRESLQEQELMEKMQAQQAEIDAQNQQAAVGQAQQAAVVDRDQQTAIALDQADKDRQVKLLQKSGANQ